MQAIVPPTAGKYVLHPQMHYLFLPVYMCLCVCLKVLDWIENHGEAFLSKHTGVGKSLHRARALQKRHEDFEEVAQVSKANTFCSVTYFFPSISYFCNNLKTVFHCVDLTKKNPKQNKAKC